MFDLKRPARALSLAAALVASAGIAASETRVTLKSASATSSYYVMMVQLGEMLRAQSGGAILPTVEESQGSVQNVAEAGRRPGAFLFTSPPNLIASAIAGNEPFERGGDFEAIRTLFPMPFITIHLVVRADSDIHSVSDLAGRSFISGGTGTFCQRQIAGIFDTLGIGDSVTAPEMELSGAPSALRNNQVDGYATCSSHPTPQVQELAATLPVRILSFTEDERTQIIAANPGAGAVAIGAGTYAGIDEDIATMAVPVGAYATNMDDDTALAIVSAFWEQRETLAETNPWWAGVTPELVPQLGAPLHAGVEGFYAERGISMP